MYFKDVIITAAHNGLIVRGSGDFVRNVVVEPCDIHVFNNLEDFFQWFKLYTSGELPE